MKRWLLLALLALLALFALFAAHAQADDFWSGLWRNTDQRGDALLRQGQAAAAAKTYADPRRRAYAELQAGDYARAARDYAVFDDADAQYNRGNALAHLGRLTEALQAFDAVLARESGHRDARRNRDLVAQQLQKRPPPAAGAGQGKQESDAPTHSGEGAGNRGSASGARPASPPPPGEGPGEREAASALNTVPAAEALAALKRPAENATPLTPADSRQARVSREHWLRQIPDDPGGLLRRKFMIEHMQRQNAR